MYSWNPLLDTFMKQVQTVTLLHYVCLSVSLSFSPSFHEEQLGSHWVDFCEI